MVKGHQLQKLVLILSLTPVIELVYGGGLALLAQLHRIHAVMNSDVHVHVTF